MIASRQRGFTLLEVTVVMVIIAILAGFITLSIGNRADEDRLQVQAQRLQQLLGLAADESQLKGIPLGLQFTDDGYRFLTLDPKTKHWLPYQTSGPLRPRPLPAPFRVELRIDDRAVPPQPAKQPPEKVKPQVLIYSSGQMTAFHAVFSAPGVPLYYVLSADDLGNVTLRQVQRSS